MNVSGLEVKWVRFEMKFKKPAKTSRGALLTKPSWLIRVQNAQGNIGWGECSLIPGLSVDEPSAIESHLQRVQRRMEIRLDQVPRELPALHFALETAMADLSSTSDFAPFPGGFSRGESRVEINGLIWMDEPDGLIAQAQHLLNSGFKTLKAKVGSMPFAKELEWIQSVREIAPDIVFRVDANGAFSNLESGWTSMQKLEALAKLGLHSIEQPLLPEDRDGLAALCQSSPLPIALDESLIGVPSERRGDLLDAIGPDFLVLKPSLLGGFAASQDWIAEAECRDIKWWVTSALETNLGLNAIAQWTANGVVSKDPLLPQGLGTGGLFVNNVSCPLEVRAGYISAQGHQKWQAPELHDAGTPDDLDSIS